MYGLKEAGIIAFKQLVPKLEPFGYHPMEHTPGLWRHKTRKTTFALCVDDFGVKYYSKEDALHLIDAFETNYKLTSFSLFILLIFISHACFKYPLNFLVISLIIFVIRRHAAQDVVSK